MSMGLFVDISNLYFSVIKQFDGGLINYPEYRRYIEAAENQGITRAFAYGLVTTDNQRESFFEMLRNIKFETHMITVPEGLKYIQWNVPMIIDIMKYVDHFDTIVIGSNDYSLVPLVKEIKNRGKRAVIFGCRISKGLKQTASAFYEVDADCDLIRMPEVDRV